MVKKAANTGKRELAFNQAGTQSVKITAAPCKNFRFFRSFGPDRESQEGRHAPMGTRRQAVAWEYFGRNPALL